MDNSVPQFMFVSLLVGLFTGWVSFYYVVIEPNIKDCEQNLPRTQHCMITAIPEKMKGK